MSVEMTLCQVATCDRPSDGWFVCKDCASRAEEMLGEVSWLLEELDTVKSLQTRYTEQAGRTKGTKEKPLPINLKASDVTGSLVMEIDTTARLIADENGWDREYQDAARIDEFGTVTAPGRVAAWLAHRMAAVRLHPAGGELIDGLTRWHSAAMWVIDRPPGKRYYGDCTFVHPVFAEPCTGSVRGKVGDSLARCDTCGEEYDAAAKAAEVLDKLNGHLATIAEIATLSLFLGLTMGREQVRRLLHYWVRHGRLVPAQSKEGVDQYRLSEARGLLEAEDFKRRDTA